MSSTDVLPPTDEPPLPTFDSLPLNERTRQAIGSLGWEVPTPVQMETYAPAVAGNDLIVQARTGTGKTAAFGIPLVDRLVKTDGGTQALILSPTRELALQSARQIEELTVDETIRVTAVYGGAPMGPQVRALEEGAHIISGTPGRVLDHLKRGNLDGNGLQFLILDEADEMLSMGFARELNAIMERLNQDRQTLLFSATVDDDVKRMAQRHMKDPTFVTLSGDVIGAATVAHFTYMVSGVGRARDLARVLETENPESAIIFCNTKAETESTAAVLQQHGYTARWLNGDLPQRDREKIMEQTRVGKLRFLVATDVAARGIDISHLTHVINFSFPQSAAQYIHRTGRTGRAGRTGTALSLISPQELSSLYYLRLQYKIYPVERSLPSPADDRTRLETDRVLMLEKVFKQRPAEMDYAVARRLLTHPEAERVIASLLGNFFGTRSGDPDEEAAATRRAEMPRPVPNAEPAPAQSREAPKRRTRSTRKNKPTESERSDRGQRRTHNRGPTDANAAAAAPKGEPPEPTPSEARRQKPASRNTARRAPADEAPLVASEDEVILKVNLGRQDQTKARDLGMFILKSTNLTRAALRRVRVRERTTLLVVAKDSAAVILDTMAGREFKGKEMKVARIRERR